MLQLCLSITLPQFMPPTPLLSDPRLPLYTPELNLFTPQGCDGVDCRHIPFASRVISLPTLRVRVSTCGTARQKRLQFLPPPSSFLYTPRAAHLHLPRGCGSVHDGLTRRHTSRPGLRSATELARYGAEMGGCGSRRWCELYPSTAVAAVRSKSVEIAQGWRSFFSARFFFQNGKESYRYRKTSCFFEDCPVYLRHRDPPENLAFDLCFFGTPYVTSSR